MRQLRLSVDLAEHGDWPQGYGFTHLSSVDSTNAEGFRRARAPLWILADEQTAGRGRRARAWASPRGNFYGSLILKPEGTAAAAAQRSFVTALALHDAFSALIGSDKDLTLKWPNDVLLGGGKVAGILLERQNIGARAYLAIGIGVNMISHPMPEQVEPGAVPPVSLLAQTGLRVTPQTLLEHLAPAYARREAQFVEEGFAPLRAAWLACAARLNEVITARTNTSVLRGTFETIDAQGNLVLVTAKGRVALPAADIFF